MELSLVAAREALICFECGSSSHFCTLHEPEIALTNRQALTVRGIHAVDALTSARLHAVDAAYISLSASCVFR